MSRIRGIVLDEVEVREVPKHGLTLDEVAFSYGSPELVKRLRAISALKPCGSLGRTLLFDTGDVARVWAEWKAGKFERLLREVDGSAG